MNHSGSQPLIILGGGGQAKATLDVIATNPELTVTGILDDSLGPRDTVVGVPVLGTTSRVAEFAESHRFVIAVGKIGRSMYRKELAELCWREGGKLHTVISRLAYVSPSATVGEGSIVLHRAVINAGARIGSNSIINTLALIEHDSTVGDHSHISTGALINGGCMIGSDVFVGSGVVLHHRTTLADGQVIAAGKIVKPE